MAAPVLASKGTASKVGNGAVTPAYPATVAANDIFILMVSVMNTSGTQTAGIFTAPAGWELITEGTGTTSNLSVGRAHTVWFWRRGNGSETGTVSITNTTINTGEQGIAAQIYRITGCITTGLPWESFAVKSDGAATTTPVWPAIHVGGTERLVLAFIAQADDAPGADVPTPASGSETYTDALGIDADATNADTQLEVFNKNNTSDGSEATSAAGGETNGWVTLHIAFAAAAQADFSGLSQSKGANAGAPANLTVPIPAGVLLLAFCASDNTSASDGETSEHIVADSQGHTWTKLREHCKSGGAAAAGVTGSIWATKVTTQLETTDTVTLTATGGGAVIALRQVSLNPGRTFALAGTAAAVGTGTTRAATLAGLPSGGYLLVGLEAVEATVGDISTIQDSDYAPGPRSASVLMRTGSSTIYLELGGRLANPVTGDTYTIEAGNSRDWTTLLVALEGTDDAAPPSAVRHYGLLLGVG